MTKQEYVTIISERCSKTKKDVNLIIDEFINLMTEEIKNNNKFSITNFGTLEKSITKPINIYSPYDGKLLENVPQVRVRFKSSNYLKQILSEKIPN